MYSILYKNLNIAISYSNNHDFYSNALYFIGTASNYFI